MTEVIHLQKKITNNMLLFQKPPWYFTKIKVIEENSLLTKEENKFKWIIPKNLLTRKKE